MCRRNLLLGTALIAGGVGIILSLFFTSAFFKVVLAAVAIVLGIILLDK